MDYLKTFEKSSQFAKTSWLILTPEIAIHWLLWFQTFSLNLWFGLIDMSLIKVEMFLKGSLDSMPSCSPSMKIQIMGGKVCLKCKGKTLLGDVNKLFVFKGLLTIPSNVLLLYLKQTFPPIIWVFTESEGDGIETRLPFKIFSTLWKNSKENFSWCYFQYKIDNFC